jgi:hypothetical protein
LQEGAPTSGPKCLVVVTVKIGDGDEPSAQGLDFVDVLDAADVCLKQHYYSSAAW